MEFFRKYQRVILYSAGLFALVSFSITGPILEWASRLNRNEGPLPTLVVGGRTVQVTPEDRDFAAKIARWEAPNTGGVRAFVMPVIRPLNGGDDAVQVYAAMRRVAIEQGIEVSDIEIDRAIEQAVELVSSQTPEIDSPTALALRKGFGSLGAFREVLREAMRIGTLARLESLGIDTSDAALAQLMLRDLELIGMDVAVIDAETLEEQVKSDLGEISDEVLKAWLEEPDTDKSMMVDPDKFRADLPYLQLADLDLAQFAEELGELEISDQEIENFYTNNRARLFRIEAEPQDGGEDGGEDGGAPAESGAGGDPKDGEDQGKGGNGGSGQDGTPQDGGSGDTGADDTGAEETGAEETGAEETGAGDAGSEDPQDPPADGEDAAQQPPEPQFVELDDALKAQIRTRLQAEAVMEALWKKVQESYDAHLEPGLSTLDTALEARDALELTLIDAQAAAAVEGLSEEDQAAADAAVAAAETALETGQATLEQAEGALAELRASFDLAGLWTGELANGRAGFGMASTGEQPVEIADLAEVEPFGAWPGAGLLYGLTDDNPFGSQVQHAADHIFQVRLVDRVERPLKPIDDIREEATTRYISEQADERATAVVEAFEAKVEELARAAIADKITELESERDANIETRMTEWRDELSQRITETRARLERFVAERGEFAKPTKAERARLEAAEAELADEAAHREELVAELEAETEEAIAEQLREQYSVVLADAVAAVDGVVLEKVGPLPKDLGTGQRGARRQSYSKAVQWAFFTKRLEGLDEVGDAVELTEDLDQRAWFLPVVTSVEKGSISDLTRRQLLGMRQQSVGAMRSTGTVQSYDLDALKARYGWKAPDDEPAADAADAADAGSK